MKRNLTKVAVYFLCFVMMFTSFVYPVQALTYTGNTAVTEVKGLAGDLIIVVEGLGFENLNGAQISASIKEASGMTEIIPTNIGIDSDTILHLELPNTLEPGSYKLMLWADQISLVGDSGKEFQVFPRLKSSYTYDTASGPMIKVENSTYEGYKWTVDSLLDLYLGSKNSNMDLNSFNNANKNISKTAADVIWALPALLSDGTYFVDVKDTSGKLYGHAEFTVGSANTPNPPPMSSEPIQTPMYTSSTPEPSDSSIPGPTISGISFMVQGTNNLGVHGYNLNQLDTNSLTAVITDGNNELGRTVTLENEFDGFRFFFDKAMVLAPGSYYLKVMQGNTPLALPNSGLFNVIPKLAVFPDFITGEGAGQTIQLTNSASSQYTWAAGDLDIKVDLKGPDFNWTATPGNGLTVDDNQLLITTTENLSYPLKGGEYEINVRKVTQNGSVVIGISRIFVGHQQIIGKVVKPEDNTTGIGGGFINVESKAEMRNYIYPVNDDGSFIITNLTQNVEYDITAIAPEDSVYSNSARQLAKYEGQTLNLTFKLTIPQITGTIVDPYNNPAGYAGVDVFKADNTAGGSDWIGYFNGDRLGNFKIGNLLPGNYRIEAGKYGSEYIRSDSFQFTIDDQSNYTGANPQLKLVSPQIKGRIYDKHGLLCQDSHLEGWSTTDYKGFASNNNGGYFYIGKLGPGTYKIKGVSNNGSFAPSKETEIKVDATGIYVNNIPYSYSNYVDLNLTDIQIKGKVYEPGGNNVPATYGRVEVYDNIKNKVAESNINYDGTYALGGLYEGSYTMRAVKYSDNGSFESNTIPVEIQVGNIIKISGLDYVTDTGFDIYLKAKAWQYIDQNKDSKINKNGNLTLKFHGFNGDLTKLSAELGYTPATIKLSSTTSYVDGTTTTGTAVSEVVLPILTDNNKEYVQVRALVDKFNGTINWNSYDGSYSINIGTKSGYLEKDNENLIVINGRSYITLDWFITNMQMDITKGDYIPVVYLSNALVKGQSTDGFVKDIGFTPDTNSTNILNTFTQSIYLTAKVRYAEDTANIVSEVLRRSVELDLAPPSADVFFKGLVHDDVDGKDYYAIHVDFFDQVLLEDIVANKAAYFSLNHNSLPVSPVKLVPEWSEQTTGPVGRAILYFDEVSSGDLFTVHGLKDIVGNTMAKDIIVPVKIFVRVKATFKDGNGNLLPNTSFMYVRTDSLSNTKSAATETGGNSTGLKTEPGMTDFEGVSILDLEQGTYKIYSVNISSPEYKRIQLDVDFEAKPKVGSSEVPLEVIASEKLANVSGMANIQAVLVNNTAPNGYELVFIEKKYLKAPFTGVDEYMLQEAFGKRAMVAADGSFNIYLTPGETGNPREYILLGVRQYQGDQTIILPKNEIKILVEGNQAINLNNGMPIDFVTQEIAVGKLYKNQTEVQGDVKVQIERIGLDYSIPTFKTWADYTGDIKAKLPNGSYRISTISKDGYSDTKTPDGTGATTQSGNSVLYTTNITFTINDGVISNVSGTADINKIVLPAINATVNLVKKGILLTGYADITFMNYNGREIYLHNSNSGRFDFSLAPGTYKIKSISSQESGYVAVENDPKSTLVVGEGFDKTGSNAIVYDFGIGNVFIKVVDDNVNQNSRPNISLNISGQRDEDGTKVYKWGKTDSDGQVSFILKPGKYVIDGFDDGGTWKQVNIPFEVTSADTIEIPKTVLMKISPPNTKLIFKDEAGNLLAGKWVNLKKIKSASEYWDTYMGFNTDINGEYNTNLKLGDYVIEGIQTSKEWKQLNISFIVDENVTSSNPLTKIVVIAAPVLNAILKDESGSAIANTWINLRKVTSLKEQDRYFGFSTDSEGKFSGDLEAGEYIVEGVNIWKANLDGTGFYEWREIKKQFYVVMNTSSKLEMRLTLDGAAVTLLDVSIPKNNFTGYLYKTYESNVGIPFTTQKVNEGSWVDINLVLKQKDVLQTEFDAQPWMYQKWINVKPDGSFSVMLDAAHDYIITEAYVEGVRYDINLTITKEQLNTPDYEFVVVPPKPNVSGTVKGFDDKPVANKGWINFSSPDNTKWEWAEIGADGTFGKNMEAGQQYIIREVTIMSDDNDWNKTQRFQLDKNFIVGEGSQNMVIKPNLKGTIDFGNLFEGTTPQSVSISIRPKLEKDDPNYIEFINNPWKYEKWISVTMSVYGDTGTFYATLDDGTYTINGLSTTLGWQQMNEEFSLSQTTAGNVTYDAALTRYELNINMSANVTGEIYDINGAGISGANLSIERTGDLGQNVVENIEVFNWQDRYFNVNADDAGKFAIKLKDGNYRINGYNTKWTQGANGDWASGQWINLNYVFKVESGVLKNIDDAQESTLPKIVIKPNVKVVVEKIYNAGDWADGYAQGTLTAGQYAKLKLAWVNIKPYKLNGSVYYLDDNDNSNNVWVNTGSDGDGILTLKPGKYKVLDAGGNNFYTRVDKDFDIDVNGNMVDDNTDNFINTQTKTLTVSQQKPNFKGTVYIDKDKSVKLNSGWISVVKGKTGEIDWSKAHWFNVKADGTFEEFLGDSDTGWRIINVSGYKADGSDVWMKTNIALTAQGGIITPDKSGYLNTENTLDITPPIENLTGIVSYKSNSNGQLKQVEGNAWLTIKPANNSANDWTGAFGADYKEYGTGIYKFSVVADPGNYKVVSVGGFDSQTIEYFWYETDLRFTIDADGRIVYNNNIVPALDIAPPLPNVTGTATISGTQAVGKGSISFARFNNQNQQVKIDGTAITADEMAQKYAGDDVHWWFAKWTEIANDGSFGINLPVIDDGGYYKVIDVYGQNGWYRSDAKFSYETVNSINVLNKIDDNNTKMKVETLVISQPGPNVTLNITNAPTASDKAWLEVELNENGNKFIYSFISESKVGSDNNFTFKAKLKNGSYIIKSIGTSTAWNAVDGNGFSVTGTNTFAVDLTSVTSRRELAGQITGVTNSVWVALKQYDAQNVATDTEKWVQTDSAGNFSIKVDINSKWAVTNVKTAEGNKSVKESSIVIKTASTDSTSNWSINVETDLL
ncbi:hypothetical protein [Pseudobacteroides cellulosolvens]|uniref:Uncharacterized protein n=1 Tax=Pseudobacteroides cellulosolvens ATCC 35603 = DSM 2933 TaxID=398512 RepID=A0A0L6JL11_9FIRM|nr:hypothetical protein [Pseudobacteroides cellulosolvens]KNY26484.1 hypothetical protein Bccel_1749 [Pseudobacteroides cellulosolvens ATCC 35603 = DSM 2933]